MNECFKSLGLLVVVTSKFGIFTPDLISFSLEWSLRESISLSCAPPNAEHGSNETMIYQKIIFNTFPKTANRESNSSTGDGLCPFAWAARVVIIYDCCCSPSVPRSPIAVRALAEHQMRSTECWKIMQENYAHERGDLFFIALFQSQMKEKCVNKMRYEWAET